MEEEETGAPAARAAAGLLEEKLLHVLRVALVLFLGLAIQRQAEAEALDRADWSILMICVRRDRKKRKMGRWFAVLSFVFQ